jgi:hypothetical protein
MATPPARHGVTRPLSRTGIVIFGPARLPGTLRETTSPRGEPSPHAPGHGPAEPYGETTVFLRFGARGGFLSALVLRVSARCERIMVAALSFT